MYYTTTDDANEPLPSPSFQQSLVHLCVYSCKLKNIVEFVFLNLPISISSNIYIVSLAKSLGASLDGA